MNLKIGIGKYDITGPCAEIGFMGYWDFTQRGSGIHFRLFSRAFVIEDLSNGKSVAIVCADMGMCFQSVQQAVVKKLKARFGGTYTEKNVMICGSHTHSGPGGYSHHLIYNGSMLGFNKQNFDCIVEGIFQSVVRAHENKVKGKILLAKADVDDCGANRSIKAYKENRELIQDPNLPPEFKEMTLLKFVNDSGDPVGSLNWFAVHPTNLGQKNTLISGDNKGYAAELLEKDKGVVSAFANSCCGDISANVGLGIPDGIHDIERAIGFGRKQYLKAAELFDGATEELEGEVDYRQKFVDMSQCIINGERRTWPAALGLGMTSGSSEDSVGAQLWPEGTTKEDVENDPNLLSWILGQILSGLSGLFIPKMEDNYIKGQGEKAILTPVGLIKVNGIPIAPSVLPLQLIKIGGLIIIAHPGEITTMSGRRLRKSVLNELSSAGVDHAVIAAYAGAFSSYTTTQEEYSAQHYEGASTLYGPWTLEAFQQENEKLAVAIRNHMDVEPGPEPPDLSDRVISPPMKVWFDGVPLEKKFGDARIPPKPSYHPGEKAEVSFYGAHPNNELRIEATYLQVEKLNSGQWETLFTDRDSCTYFRWKPTGIAGSEVTIEWRIPDGQAAGVYRIRYNGHWKSFLTGEIKEFSGVSREFAVL